MYTHLCLTQLLNRPTHQSPKKDPGPHSERSSGQVLVIFAVSLVALLLFIGLAVDAGSLYLTYDQLKRAVDASAVSAANDFKRGVTTTQMYDGAEEVLKLHNVDLDTVTLKVYTCDTSIFPNLATDAPSFYNLCPSGTENKRKLVYVQATEKAPLYFLSLLGIPPVSLTTNSISEAAPIDLVIVLDTSTSMGFQSPGYVGNDFDPTACNAANTCQPLKSAKDAAKLLIDKMYQGYDRVGIVTFAQTGKVHKILATDGVTFNDLTYNLPGADAVIDDGVNGVSLHYDPPFARMWRTWQVSETAGGKTQSGLLAFNPANPEDRNGDGSDTDITAFSANNGSYPVCTGYPGYPNTPPADATTPGKYPNCCFPNLPVDPINHPYPRDWDYTKNPYNWVGAGGDYGVPCDDENLNDTYNWSVDNGVNSGFGPFNSVADPAGANAWLAAHPGETLSPLSTCSGCGIRLASDILKSEGRPTAVWIMVFLSDGGVNMSDTFATDPTYFTGSLKTAYPNGFCSGALGTDGNAHINSSTHQPDPQGLWWQDCTDLDLYNRECIKSAENTCPPNPNPASGPSYSTGTKNWTISYDATTTDSSGSANWLYTPLDYALDMTDQAALTVTTAPAGSAHPEYYNPHEIIGNDIAIYTIGVGQALGATGQGFLRYMAAVGDDGDRVTDPCDNSPDGTYASCGNYYWDDPSNPNALNKIFEDIASRIYTRITG